MAFTLIPVNRRRLTLLATLLFSALIALVLWQITAEATGNAANMVADCSSPNAPSLIESNTTLSGTLFATQNVKVSGGAVLTLTAGTQFIFCGNYELFASNGRLHFVGTAAEPIVFDSEDSVQKWRGISFPGSGSPILTSTLQYVEINNGGGIDPAANWGAIYISGSPHETVGDTPVIDHVTINNSGSYGIFVRIPSGDPTPPRLSNLTINDSASAPLVFYAAAVGGLGDGNSFSNNGKQIIEVRVEGSTGGSIDHSQTWRDQPLPYELAGTGLVIGDATNLPVLTLEPGVTLWVGEDSLIRVNNGGLIAEGTVTKPITITKVPSGPLWRQILFEGNIVPGSRLAYVNIEYAGNSDQPTLEIQDGTLSLDHVTVRYNDHAPAIYSSVPMVEIKNSTIAFNKVGFQFDLGAGGLLRNNLIQGNSDGGILVTGNGKKTCIDALGNDWGNASGPADGSATLDNCNQAKSNAGGGDAVSDDVLYEPWLSGAGLNDRSSISPDPYWVIANGLDQALLTITVRDANGRPVPGKLITLSSTQGVLQQPSALTNASGVTTATITSTVSGDAIITARNVTDDQPLAALAAIHFWQGLGNVGGLFDPRGVPYVSPDLVVEGLPIQLGYPITMSVPMENGNPDPVHVVVTYSVSNLNVGARFTPVAQVSKTLGVGEGWNAAAGWLPNVTGHHCIQTEITVSHQPPLAKFTAQDDKTKLQHNYKVIATATKLIRRCPANAGILIIDLLTGFNGNLTMNAMPLYPDRCKDFPHDPPVHEYDQIASIAQYTPPSVEPIDGVTQAQADALNGIAGALFRLYGLGDAILTSNDRLGGAATAGDREWSARQSQAVTDFYHQYGLALMDLAAALETLLAATEGAGLDDRAITIQEQIDVIDAVRANGFDQETLDWYQASGLDAEQIASLEQTFVTMLPKWQLKMTTTYDILRETRDIILGVAEQVLAPPPVLQSAVTQTARAQSAAAPAREIGTLENEFVVGNPTDNKATVNLQIRPVDVPLSWIYYLDIPAPELDPGESTTVTLTLDPGGTVLEDTEVRVAVEGFIGDELVGGILFNPTIPSFTLRTNVFLPLVAK